MLAPELLEKKFLKLLSSNGDALEIGREAACMSKFIKDMIEDSEDVDTPIPLAHVKTDVLSKIIEYCEYHHQNAPKHIVRPLKSANLLEVVSEWDFNFVDVDKAMLFELMKSANYLAIESLLDLTCAKVASMMKDKSAEEIRKEFDIVNDFTPEEEIQVREENRWCEDSL